MKIDTQGMSAPADPNIPTRPVEEQQRDLKPAEVTPKRLISACFARELKILINEVLHEREYKKRVNGSYDTYKEPPASYFEAENFRHFVGDEEPNYESWEQPWD